MIFMQRQPHYPTETVRIAQLNRSFEKNQQRRGTGQLGKMGLQSVELAVDTETEDNRTKTNTHYWP